MKSTWQNSIDLPIYPPLAEDIKTDVVIIGAGIAGISCAYLLAKAGQKVVLIDKSTLNDSMTSCTTAFLTSAIDTSLSDLVKIFGAEKARDIWMSHDEAISDIEKIVESENIDCEFMRVPEHFFATTLSGLADMKEDQKLAQGFGFETEDLGPKDLAIKNSGGFVLGNRAKFNPFKYLAKLRRAAEFFGALICENTEALSIEEGSVVKVRTTGGTIEANHCVVATHLPIKNPFSVWARKGLYHSYVMEFKIGSEVLPEGLYEDDLQPYHYLRIDKTDSYSRLLVGGEDHRRELKMDPEKNFAALEDYLKSRLPGMQYELVTKWRGSVIETIDGLAFIGSADKHKNIFYATGFSGNGMTYSQIAAKIISGEILGAPDRYAYLYTPQRDQFTMTGLWIKTCDYVSMLFGGFLKNLFKSPKFERVTPIDH